MSGEIQIRERDKLTDFEKSYPKQLDLWELRDKDKEKSYLTGFWDLVPKYVQSQPEYINGMFLKPINRRFLYDGMDFEIDILPAKIEITKGDFRDFFPSLREELIEQAVRRLSFKKEQRAILDHKKDTDRKDLYSGFFSLNELRTELALLGHTCTVKEIKESLDICARTIIILRSIDGKLKITAPIFPSVGLKEEESPENETCFVQFHPLVTKSLTDKSSRLFGYKIYMECKHYISRYLHKRLTDRFTQANEQIIYNILLSTLLRDAGISNNWRISHNIEMVEDALTELINVGVLYKELPFQQKDKYIDIRESKTEKTLKEGYILRQRKKENKILGFQTFVKKEKNRIIDAKFFLYPSNKFISEVIKANEYARCHQYNLHPNAK